ncbi:MAG: AAA family ATPase [Flavobacteriales bacterium]|nr:AAA family ATPase [Flavobacteriales bacterium]
MLHRLRITNYLLIDQLELELAPGLTIITGETGSGKSILIGALGLAMGERADAGLARDPRHRCVIELELDGAAPWINGWCLQAGVPVEHPLIIRRQLEPGGRSRAFVNDTPVRLEQLRDLGERLIHVHSQHHTLLLNDPRFQLGLVDQVAGHAKAVTAYRADHRAWRAVEEELARARAEEERARTELDYLAFQLDELDQAQLADGEQEALEAELDRAEHAGELLTALQRTEQALTGEGGVVPGLSALRQHLAKAARHDAGLAALADRMHAAAIELGDIAGDADRLATTVRLDPAHAARLRERLDLLLRLQVKHRVKGSAELIALREDLRARHGRIGTLGGAHRRPGTPGGGHAPARARDRPTPQRRPAQGHAPAGRGGGGRPEEAGHAPRPLRLRAPPHGTRPRRHGRGARPLQRQQGPRARALGEGGQRR